jgi:hypothetical protein
MQFLYSMMKQRKLVVGFSIVAQECESSLKLLQSPQFTALYNINCSAIQVHFATKQRSCLLFV